MHSTGIIKDIDELGRFVIPGSIRRKIGFKTFEIFLDGDDIVLKKIDAEYCVFCESKNDLIKFNSKRICKTCFDKIKDIKK